MTSPTNEQQRVDVLAVMDRAVEILHGNAWGEDREELEEARAAVAKLIKATSSLIEFVEPILTASGFGYVGRIEKARKALANVGAHP